MADGGEEQPPLKIITKTHGVDREWDYMVKKH